MRESNGELGRNGRPPVVYIESSALVAALMEKDPAALAALGEPARWVTSALTFAESYRAVIRARVANRLTDAQERDALQALRSFEPGCATISITDAVLDRVRRPFPVEPIRALDAIHVATAELVDAAPQLVTVLTRNTRVRDNARALGHPVI
ncbi:MAG: type II toxin-antitoxin system VapC family toxin [Gemmatimonadaceae bacterium]